MVVEKLTCHQEVRGDDPATWGTEIAALLIAETKAIITGGGGGELAVEFMQANFKEKKITIQRVQITIKCIKIKVTTCITKV